MIDVTFTFNSFDLAPFLSKYTVTHVVEQAGKMTTLDGTERVALRRRPTISFVLVPLSDAQAASIYTALSAGIANVTYTDPHRNTTASGEFYVASNIEEQFGITSIDGNRYYKGGTITLRQRAVL